MPLVKPCPLFFEVSWRSSILLVMYVAVDIGGTKTLVAVFSKDGQVIEQIKFPTPTKYDDFKIELANSVDNLTTDDFRSAGVAMPGRIDRKHGIGLAFGNLPWESVHLQSDAEKILKCPVRLENDAKLAALSEALLLLPTYKKTLYVTISTGIGAGLIVNGKIDPNFADMEAGQMLLEHEGRLRDWEDFGSGRAFQAKFGKRVSDVDDDDSSAWYWLARNIAVGLIDLMATLTPEVIVLGGGVGAHLEKFKDRLDEQLKIYENPMFPIPPIVKAQRAEDAVIYGCYVLAKGHHESVN